jgi:hypothetical protein
MSCSPHQLRRGAGGDAELHGESGFSLRMTTYPAMEGLKKVETSIEM